MGEIEDFLAVGALVGKLFGGAVGVGDERGAVESIVIKGQRVGSRAGGGADAAVEIRGEGGAVAGSRERPINWGQVPHFDILSSFSILLLFPLSFLKSPSKRLRALVLPIKSLSEIIGC